MTSMNQNRLSRAAQRTYQAAYPHVPTAGSTRFVAWMGEQNFAPRDVAERIGCTAASVNAWASGRRVPTIELARRIEKLANIPVVAWVEVVSDSDTNEDQT